MKTMCSFCQQIARWMGAGQDGDFYCDRHRHMAPGAVVDITDLD